MPILPTSAEVIDVKAIREAATRAKEVGAMLSADAQVRVQIAVEAGSSLPTSKSARMAEADTLFAMNGIDREALLEAHNFPNRAKITSRMRELEAQQGAMEAQQTSARAAAGRTS